MRNKRWFPLSLLFLTTVSIFAAAPLDGTKWKLTGWTLSSLDPKDFAITLAFSGGNISGSGGVNSYGGSYEAKADGSISLGPISMTEMAGPETAMRAESAFFTLFGQTKSFKVKGDALTLFDKNGNEQLIFKRDK